MQSLLGYPGFLSLFGEVHLEVDGWTVMLDPSLSDLRPVEGVSTCGCSGEMADVPALDASEEMPARFGPSGSARLQLLRSILPEVTDTEGQQGFDLSFISILRDHDEPSATELGPDLSQAFAHRINPRCPSPSGHPHSHGASDPNEGSRRGSHGRCQRHQPAMRRDGSPP